MSEPHDYDEYGCPVGAAVPGFKAPPPPPSTPMQGRHCDVLPLDPARDAVDLFHAYGAPQGDAGWSYLPYGPFAAFDEFRGWLESYCTGSDPMFHVIVPRESGRAEGMASYLRITPAAAVIEVGHIHYSPLLQRTVAATEAMYLMMRRVFELGYRRYEWKCNSLNRASRDAAMRLGFSFEGVFRQALVVKGRNRDTAWYACIDAEWPALEAAFEKWLAPENFDDDGRQRVSLSTLTAPVLVKTG